MAVYEEREKSMNHAEQKSPHIIVLGNEKGGTGKSTTAMHLVVSLLREGFSVGTLDLDARQGTFSRYVENRQQMARDKSYDTKELPHSEHIALLPSTQDHIEKAQQEDDKNLSEALLKLSHHDFIIIDTPGHNLYLARQAHGRADTLITPLNDSFVDLDVMAKISGETLDIIAPSHYAEWVWEQKKNKALREKKSMDWIVLRNRLTNINAKNKENMEKVLTALAKRIGFRFFSGFGERVIFRELFLNGLTLLDLKALGMDMSLSHVTARQELRALLLALNLPTITQKLEKGA